MSASNLTDRPFRAFLSHASADKDDIVNGIYFWCKDIAAIRVWYDTENFAQGMLGSEIARAMSSCQSALIVVSEASVRSRWVEREFNIAMKQQERFPGYQIVPIRLNSVKCPPELDILKGVAIGATGFDGRAATQLIEALYWHESDPYSLHLRPVYLAKSWHGDSRQRGDDLVSWLRNSDVRAIGDAPDQTTMSRPEGETRIKRLVESCSGLVALLPCRHNGTTSDYIKKEIKFALDAKLPVIAILEPGLDHSVLAELSSNDRLEIFQWDALTAGTAVSLSVPPKLKDFVDDLGRPKAPAYCFYGYGFKGRDKGGGDETKNMPHELSGARHSYVRRTIEAVSGMRCIVGDDIIGQEVQPEIVERIRRATFCVFDISELNSPSRSSSPEGLRDSADRSEAGYLLNTCIEAGIALGAGVPFALLSSGTRRRPPFMFRGQQVLYYDSELDQIGQVHKACLNYRRKSY